MSALPGASEEKPAQGHCLRGNAMALEPICSPAAGPADFVRDLSAENAVNALVAFAFSVSGPVAIILAVAARGGLSEAQAASWLFGAFFINGILSIAFCA